MISITVPTLLRGVVSVILPLTIAACGASGENGEAPGVDVAGATSEAKSAEVVAATNAAASENVAPEIAMKMHAITVNDESTTDRFIVKYKASSAEGKDTSAVRSKLSRLRSAFPAKANHHRRMGIGSDVVTTERKLNASDANAFMRAIASDPDVEYVEPDVEMTIQSAPNDPYYFRQWFLKSNLTDNITPGIRAEGAWEISKGRGSVIGIVDTGVTNHSDFSANLVPGYMIMGVAPAPGGFDPGLTSGSCGLPWHGTHVAGIAAAQTNNGVGVAGVAPEAKLLSVRSLGTCGTGSLADVADGITWAVGGTLPNVPVNANPATVINLSLAQKSMCSQTMQNAIDFATSKGAIVVTAAGNDREDVAQWQPANCRNVIAVSGSDGTYGSWVSSNYGAGVDIAAPAGDIWSTYNSGIGLPGAESYGYMSGTSMSVPMVSGVIALAQAVLPKSLSVAEFRALLQQSVQPFAAPPDRVLGPGILDAQKTVAVAKSGVIPVAADFTCEQATNSMLVTCTDRSTARGGVPIKTWLWNLGEPTGNGDMVREVSLNPYSSYEYSGIHTVKLTVTDTNGKTSSYARPVNVQPPPVVDLSAGVPKTFDKFPSDMTYLRIKLPSGVKSVTINTTFATPDQGAFMYLKDSPTSYRPDCRTNGLSSLTCTVINPPTGDYYGILTGVSKNSGTVTMSYSS
ncbi:S8 family serine peptidase [Paraburkholderia adhaesiva]|uniref:S8 family serine peptidase n=1 Tax=Paraburkholderia adhaesiva TaxID=2883244 RepID=UPI001F225F9A|nr:S8 family serine peptidase [Paraburkholderia adhaesiva]